MPLMAKRWTKAFATSSRCSNSNWKPIVGGANLTSWAWFRQNWLGKLFCSFQIGDFRLLFGGFIHVEFTYMQLIKLSPFMS
ncbi:hypothetical protein CW304_23985 [Bacillus sp. UFRGS-B20]|nr:hypothetical protein CW304_23985 [Bacillus sp. UFRGS-B20]